MPCAARIVLLAVVLVLAACGSRQATPELVAAPMLEAPNNDTNGSTDGGETVVSEDDDQGTGDDPGGTDADIIATVEDDPTELPDDGSSPGPDTLRTVMVNPMGPPVVSFVGGTATPSAIEMFGELVPVTQAVPDRPIFTDGTRAYIIATGLGGENYAVVGYTPTTSGAEGSFMQVETAAPATGTAIFGGAYSGVLVGPNGGDFDDVQGIMRIEANFDTGNVTGTIGKRGATTVTGYNMGQIVSDIDFSGMMNADGNGFTAQHSDWNSNGTIDALVHSGGAVGVLDIQHVDASGPGINVGEVSAFAVD